MIALFIFPELHGRLEIDNKNNPQTIATLSRFLLKHFLLQIDNRQRMWRISQTQNLRRARRYEQIMKNLCNIYSQLKKDNLRNQR